MLYALADHITVRFEQLQEQYKVLIQVTDIGRFRIKYLSRTHGPHVWPLPNKPIALLKGARSSVPSRVQNLTIFGSILRSNFSAFDPFLRVQIITSQAE